MEDDGYYQIRSEMLHGRQARAAQVGERRIFAEPPTVQRTPVSRETAQERRVIYVGSDSCCLSPRQQWIPKQIVPRGKKFFSQRAARHNLAAAKLDDV